MDQKIISSSILDVNIYPLSVFSDERGAVMHMLKKEVPPFQQFGEIYFSKVNFKKIKAWRSHSKITQHYAVPVGIILLVIYDGRKNSATYGHIMELKLGEENYKLITLPPGVWYGFEGLSNPYALVANCTDLPHDPNESTSLPLQNEIIPYAWKKN